MKTGIIKYNLKERGRKFRGQDRNWNIPAIVAAINSPECQEKVKNRDMIGYYGHWCRVKFGMNPQEGGLEKGKPYFIEPAIVTVHLKAHPDGTIEHQEEFLETNSGKAAAQLFKSKVGGFSSAINAGRMPQFFGFDYVFEPNYSTNRGFALDSVDGVYDAAENMTADEIDAEIQREQVAGLLQSIEAQRLVIDSANEVIQKLESENTSLQGALDAIARAQFQKEQEHVVQAEKEAIARQTRKYDFRQKNKVSTEFFLDGIRAFNNCKELPSVQSDNRFDAVEEELRKIPLYRNFFGV